MSSPQTTPRWRRRPGDRPREILRAALEVFGEQGLAGARIDDIARRAGLSKGTLYHYFPSKEALFRALVRETVDASTRGVLPADAAGAPSTLLRAFIRGFWTRASSTGNQILYRLVMAELHRFPELVSFYAEEISGSSVRFVAALVQRGIDAGEFRGVDPLAAGRLLVSLVAQNALWSGRPELFPHAAARSDEQVVGEVEDFFFRALRN
jgi:AcrR family transcriptional regulator